MKQFEVIYFSRQQFNHSSFPVEAENVEAAIEYARNNIDHILAEAAWEDWGKEDFDDFSECLECIEEDENYVVAIVPAETEIQWC